MEKYDMVDAVLMGDTRFSKASLKLITERKCRFCGKSYPEVKFDYAHLFPQSLGFKNLFSDFECEEGCAMSWFSMPIPTNHLPIVYLFKKRKADDAIPTHVASCYFQNHIINIPVPLHNTDMPSMETELTILFTPPFFATKDLGNLDIMHDRRDMSSTQKVTDDMEILTIGRDINANEKLSRYDPVTDTSEETDYEPTSLKRLIFTKHGFTVNPKDFSAFIRREFGE